MLFVSLTDTLWDTIQPLQINGCFYEWIWIFYYCINNLIYVHIGIYLKFYRFFIAKRDRTLYRSFKTLLYSLQYVILDKVLWSGGKHLFANSGDEKSEHVCVNSGYEKSDWSSILGYEF